MLRNTLGQRRRGRSTTGAPTPCLPLSLSVVAREEETEREKEAGRKEEETRKEKTLTAGPTAHYQIAAVGTLRLPWRHSHDLKPRRRTVGRKTRHHLILRSKCCSSHPKPRHWSEPHYSLDLHSTSHTSFQALCDSSRSAATHGCRVTLFHPANLHKLPNSLAIVLLNYRTGSSIGIQGADVDPDGYAEATGNIKAQGKT
uniref:Uncharacterized protein n=1 Tax=Oryza glumipatula TaxID=40148 RepID=A0A0D9YGQ1_9ORYZ